MRNFINPFFNPETGDLGILGFGVLMVIISSIYFGYRKRVELGRYSDRCRHVFVEVLIAIFRSSGDVGPGEIESIRRIYRQHVGQDVTEHFVRYNLANVRDAPPDPKAVLVGSVDSLSRIERKAATRLIRSATAEAAWPEREVLTLLSVVDFDH